MQLDPGSLGDRYDRVSMERRSFLPGKLDWPASGVTLRDERRDITQTFVISSSISTLFRCFVADSACPDRLFHRYRFFDASVLAVDDSVPLGSMDAFIRGNCRCAIIRIEATEAQTLVFF